MGLDIEFTFPDWARKLERHRAELDLFQAAIVQNNRGELFNTEGRLHGRPGWAPLRLRNGQILSNRGTLRKSLAPSSSINRGVPGPGGTVSILGDEIKVGTTIAYGRMMNDGTTKMPGGVLRPVNAKALKIPLPSGQNATNDARELRAGKLIAQLAKAQVKLQMAGVNIARAQIKKRANIFSAQQRYNSAQYRVDSLNRRISRIMETGRGGQGFIFRKWVKIPARPFIDWNERDQAALNVALIAKIVRIMNG